MGRRMDVAIVGVPKSGTSMLCNAMTDAAGRAVVLYEPVSDAFRSERLRLQAASLGFHGRNVLRWARRHEKWGVKEVLADCIRKVARWGPAHLILMVRDLRHVALSTYETNRRLPWDLERRRRRLIESAGVLMELSPTWPAERLAICRYETFVTDPDQREALRRRIDWPAFDGDVGRGLATWLERPHEADRHHGAITANSVLYRRSDPDPDARRFAAEVMAACPAFNETFGYGD
jgi:hypothetical protein